MLKHLKMNSISNEITYCAFGIVTSIFLRLCTALHPYSGSGKPPMFGDYEAQRHWQEITVNLPMNQWYYNTSSNNLTYWGLDYPPLTAYHSYLNGLLAWLINPDYVALKASQGYESEAHKLFMRYSVLISDLLVYIPSICLYFIMVQRRNVGNFNQGGLQGSMGNHGNQGNGKGSKDNLLFNGKGIKEKYEKREFPLQAVITLALIYPGLVLIDHGHFQYNCISLGLTVLAVTALGVHWDLAGSVLFVLAVNYKQMELYHAFPFFLYLLSSCIPKPGASALSGVVKLLKIAMVVLVTFGILWLPFLFHLEDTLQVLHRLFPIARGVFEDKVGNVWCALNVVYKLKHICGVQMVRYCTIATLAALLPSSANLFLSPSLKKFVPALINSSLAFFLFSYQVHEKSILLAAIPVVLYMPEKPLQCFWFLYISTFSMLPLFLKDRLVIAYLALVVFYVTSFIYCQEKWANTGRFQSTFGKLLVEFKKILLKLNSKKDVSTSILDIFRVTFKIYVEDVTMLKDLVLYVSMIFSFIGSVLLTFVQLVFDPPQKLPDLYTLMIAVYSCIHFVGFFVYFNVVQFCVPQFENLEHNCMRSRKKIKRS